ncbi:Trypsin-1, partial [Operophtera brumata]
TSSEDEDEVSTRIDFAPVIKYHKTPVDDKFIAPKRVINIASDNLSEDEKDYHIEDAVSIKRDDPDVENEEEIKIFPETHDDKKTAWKFRTYAVRRIVGGMETSISLYPYNVAISRNGKHWCGGSVIDEQWVLTAGHCLEMAYDGNKYKLQPFVVRAGTSFHNRGGYQARINKVFFPKKYVPGAADYDYSLMRLDRPLPIGRNIAVLNLPSKEYATKEGDILIVTGWGSTDVGNFIVSGFGNIPDRVRFVPVPIMALEECQKSYRFYITNRMVCAGYATGGKDACNHDSGGPAVRDGVLIGIVSFGGKQCGDPRSPGVYSRVAEVTEWVEQTISSNEASEEPELRAKIEKAKMREKELQKVEEKKDKIKSWLRETLKSSSFIELAKKKLKDAGYNTRRLNRLEEGRNSSNLKGVTLDEINLTNMINEQILGDDETNESEKLLSTLAMKEVIWNKKRKDESGSDESFDSFVKYVSGMGKLGVVVKFAVVGAEDAHSSFIRDCADDDDDGDVRNCAILV